MRASFVIGLLLAILVTVFALANRDSTEVNFLVSKVEIATSLLLLLTLALGALIAWLLSLGGWFKKRKEISKLNKQVAELTTELNKAQSQLLSHTATKAPTKDVDEFEKDVETEQ